MNSVVYNRELTAKDDWETPEELFNELNDEFHFTLDAAASEENTKCWYYYDKETNGLKHPWSTRTFVNPPYGRSVGNWVAKAYQEHKKGCTVVMLLAARTDTKWFHAFIYKKAEIRFIKGRLKFGKSKNSAPFPSMIVIWK